MLYETLDQPLKQITLSRTQRYRHFFFLSLTYFSEKKFVSSTMLLLVAWFWSRSHFRIVMDVELIRYFQINAILVETNLLV